MKSTDGKFSQLDEVKSNTNPGSTEGPNLEENKEAHCKVHHDKMTKFKDKERNLNAAREKQETMHWGTLERLAADLSTETLQAIRKWQEIFQVIKNKGLQRILLYPARLSIKMEGQITSFPDKRSLKEYTSSKPALQEILKDLL